MNQEFPISKAIHDAALSFVNAQTTEEAKRLVRSHPNELLNDAADEVLAQLIIQYGNDSEAVAYLRRVRVLLARCRNDIVDVAFEDPAPILYPGVYELVHNFVNVGNWTESKELVKANYDELVSEQADEVFDYMMLYYKDDETIVSSLQKRRDLLGVARRKGVDAAFSDLSVEIPQKLFEAWVAFVDSPSWPDARRVLERRPELLTSADLQPAIDFMLTMAREDAAREDTSTRATSELMLRKLEVHRYVLARCRREGVESIFAPHLLSQLPSKN